MASAAFAAGPLLHSVAALERKQADANPWLEPLSAFPGNLPQRRGSDILVTRRIHFL